MAEINYNNHHPKRPDLHLGLGMFLVGSGFAALGVFLLVKLPGEAWFISGMFLLIGLFFAAAGAWLIISEIKSVFRYFWLKKHGQVIWAEVVESVHDFSGSPSGWYPDEELQYAGMNRRKPAETPDRSYHVVARYVDEEGTEHLFESPRSYDEEVTFMEGDTVRVYTSKDYKKYYVDLDMRTSMFAD